MSDLNYGVNVENLLHDLSQHESSDIGEFDVYGEDEQGREGCASIDITLLASDALKIIAELKSQYAALLGGFEEAIRHKDKLAAELNAVAAENASIKANVAIHAAGFSVCPVCSHEEPSETDDIVWMVKETPATDAYLNSVRAEGIQLLLNEYAPHTIASSEASEFAARLRAGKDGE